MEENTTHYRETEEVPGSAREPEAPPPDAAQQPQPEAWGQVPPPADAQQPPPEAWAQTPPPPGWPYTAGYGAAPWPGYGYYYPPAAGQWQAPQAWPYAAPGVPPAGWGTQWQQPYAGPPAAQGAPHTAYYYGRQAYPIPYPAAAAKPKEKLPGTHIAAGVLLLAFGGLLALLSLMFSGMAMLEYEGYIMVTFLCFFAYCTLPILAGAFCLTRKKAAVPLAIISAVPMLLFLILFLVMMGTLGRGEGFGVAAIVFGCFSAILVTAAVLRLLPVKKPAEAPQPAWQAAPPALPADADTLPAEAPAQAAAQEEAAPQADFEGAQLSSGGAQLSSDGVELSSAGAQLSSEGVGVSAEGARVSAKGAQLSSAGVEITTEGAQVSQAGVEAIPGETPGED